jgi:hypothetical protein
MQSKRFGLPIVFTEHAKLRMTERQIGEDLVVEIIDRGTLKDAGQGHYWIYTYIAGRSDNLLCVAAVIDNAVVVKTIMHHWEPLP